MAGLLAVSKSHQINYLCFIHGSLCPRDGALAYVHCGHCRHIAIALVDAGFVRSSLLELKALAMKYCRRPSPFLESLREAIRVRHYSIRTEEAYMGWGRRFILFHGKCHPKDMAEAEVAAFLSHLALDRKVSPATQNQALSALSFLYTVVLTRPLEEMSGIVRAKRPRRLPTVLTQIEIGQILSRLKGMHWLIACILYGSGLRLMESVRLRVKDIDFAHQALFVRNAKGWKG